MDEKNIPLHIAEMQTAIFRIIDIYKEIDFEIFEQDWRYQSIVERQIEILSEASRKLTEDEKSLTREINWRAVAGIGNILRHEYRKVDLKILWDIAENQTPRFEVALLTLIEHHKNKKV